MLISERQNRKENALYTFCSASSNAKKQRGTVEGNAGIKAGSGNSDLQCSRNQKNISQQCVIPCKRESKEGGIHYVEETGSRSRKYRKWQVYTPLIVRFKD